MSLIAALIFAQAGAFSPEIDAVMRARKPRTERRAAPSSPQGDADGLSTALPPDIAKRLDGCIARANEDAVAGIAAARAWQAEKSAAAGHDGAAAALCLGYGLGRQGNWSAAADAFEAGAGREGLDAVTRARLWSQAGNAALIAGDARRALIALDAALAAPLPETLATGEIWLDRARARVARDDLPGARVDMSEAVRLAAADPLAWLLSATLARRMNDLPLARAHVAEAVKRAGDDASVALEQGIILALSGGQDAAARDAFARAARLAPGSDVAAKANAYLAQLDIAPDGAAVSR